MEIHWHRAPVARLVIPFIAGIIAALFISVSPLTLWILLGAGAASTAFFALAYSHLINFSFSTIPGVVINFTLLVAGMLAVHYSDATNHAGHIIHKKGYDAVLVRLLENPEEKAKTWRATAMAEKVFYDGKEETAKGKIIVYLNKNGCDSTLTYGDYLLVNKAPESIAGPLNPGEFDYKQWLERQNIYAQVFVQKNEYIKTGENITNPLYSIAFRLRENFDKILQKNIPDSITYGVAAALILGQRNHLDEEITGAFANTGTIHVLAVSGLHVAVLFYIISFLLGFTRRFKHGTLIKVFIGLCILWIYAVITGLSPSVVRSAIMFSFVAAGEAFNRKTSIYNSLAASALFMLALDANVLYNIGFQLSYLAVLGIVVMQEPLYKLLNFRRWLPDKIWQLTTVSLAAQVATFPLGIYYFHQFPNYFLISNLIIVPLSTIAMCVGVALFVLSPIPFLASIAGWLLDFLLKACIFIVQAIENSPFSYSGSHYLSIAGCALVYAAIVFILFYFATKKYSQLALALGCCIGLAALALWRGYTTYRHREFTVYALPNGQKALSYIEKNTAYLLADSLITKDSKIFRQKINPHFILANVKTIQPIGDSINTGNFAVKNDFIALGNKRILLADTNTPLSKISNIYWDYVIASHNINPVKLQAERVVVDNTNSRFAIGRWQQEAEKYNFKTYIISRQGAFQIKNH